MAAKKITPIATGKAKVPHNPKRPLKATIKAALEEGDIDKVEALLTPRQRAFAREYVVDFQAREAAIRAGYSPIPESAARMGSILLANAAVQAYITALTQSKAKQITIVDPDYVIRKVLAIINKDESKDGDRLRGLELLAKHLGMLKERVEMTGANGGPIETEQRTKEEADDFINQLNRLNERAVDKSIN